MEVKDFQNKIIEFISDWDKKRGVKQNKQSAFIHLIEEIGELAREYVNIESRKNRYSKKELENAIADVFMWVVKLANIHGIDIEKVVLKIIEEEQKLL